MVNDFSKGSVTRSIIKLAIPMTLAQIVNVLYNIVDRIYIGYTGEDAILKLTGLGLSLPIITGVIAFANLFGMGGAPLCSIERGKGNVKEAEKIMGNSFIMLIASGIIITILGLIFKDKLLYLFGASSETFGYANSYITIYLTGSIFVMLGLGMNSFINSQGFGKIGMLTVVIGAILNIILDPIFIFGFNMGVEGAALATIISQAASAIWILRFLTGETTILRLKRKAFKLQLSRLKKIVLLGLSGFIMALTNGTVQMVCNMTLARHGGDIYLGVMTIINSIREVVTMPVIGITNSAQPVIGYNYGAGLYKRAKKGIKFMFLSTLIYTVTIRGLIVMIPGFFFEIFIKDKITIAIGIPALKLYFFGFFMMALQFAGQSIYVSINKPKYAIFFSIFRKIIIVVPLTIILPNIFSLGATGVFLAEPISNFIGGIASFVTMLFMIRRELKDR